MTLDGGADAGLVCAHSILSEGLPAVRSLLRLFDRPRAAADVAEAELPKAVLGAGSPAEHAPSSGLLTVETTLSAEAPIAATLKVFVGDAPKPVLEKPVALAKEPVRGWF